MSSTQPECCRECVHLDPSGNCKTNHATCAPWRKWFHEEWRGIQAAAVLIKTQNTDRRNCTTCRYLVTCEPNPFGFCDGYEPDETNN